MKPKLLLILILVACAALLLLRFVNTPPAPPSPPPVTPRVTESGVRDPAVLEDGQRSAVQPASSAQSTGLNGVISSVGNAGAPARMLPGARVRWRSGETLLGETLSDADGRYSLPLVAYFALPGLARDRGQLEIEVRLRGFQPLRQSVPRPAEGAQELRLDLSMLPGATLAGRVLGADGQAVREANVQLMLRTKQGERELRVPVATAETDAQGRYELGFASSTRVELYARAFNAGTAWREIELVAGMDRTSEDLVLRGEGELSGFARFTDGSPVVDLDLWAVPEAVAVKPNALVLCVEEAADHERDLGLFSTRCTTAADGSFKLAGLAPGKYMLRTPTTEVVFEPRFGYYNSGTHGILLSVETQRVRVEVRDEAGTPLVGAQVSLTELNDAGDGSFETGQRWFARTRGTAGTASFNVQPESTYGLRVQGRDYEPFEELLLLAPGEFEQLRVVTLQRARERGRLQLLLSSPLGPVGAARVYRLSPLTSAPDLDLGILAVDADGWIEGLPPGEQSFSIGFADSMEAPNWLLPVARTGKVNLPAGGTRELRQELVLGGRFEVTLAIEGQVPPASQAGARETLLAEQGAFVSFEPEGGVERALNFFGPEGRVESQLLIGTPGRGVELLTPVRGTLKVAAPGCYLATQAVQLLQGSYTRVAITLRARS